MPDKFKRQDEFTIQTIEVCFYAPLIWTNDTENQRIHDALDKEGERFRELAYDLVNAIVPQPQNLDIRVGLQHN